MYSVTVIHLLLYYVICFHYFYKSFKFYYLFLNVHKAIMKFEATLTTFTVTRPVRSKIKVRNLRRAVDVAFWWNNVIYRALFDKLKDILSGEYTENKFSASFVDFITVATSRRSIFAYVLRYNVIISSGLQRRPELF